MTFLVKPNGQHRNPEGTADNFANDASTSMQADGRNSGGRSSHIHGVNIEQIMVRAKRDGYSDTESIQYKDLKQKLEKQVAMNEERKDTKEQAALYRSAQHLMDMQRNVPYGKYKFK